MQECLLLQVFIVLVCISVGVQYAMGQIATDQQQSRQNSADVADPLDSTDIEVFRKRCEEIRTSPALGGGYHEPAYFARQENDRAKLLKRFKDPDPRFIVCALRALKKLRQRDDWNAILGCLKHESKEVRLAAVRCLTPSAQSVGLWYDQPYRWWGDSGQQREQLTREILRLCERDDGDDYFQVIHGWQFFAFPDELSKRTKDRLLRLAKKYLNSEKAASRRSRASLLIALHTDDTLGLLVERYSKERDPEVKITILRGFCDWPSEALFSDIKEALLDPDERVRKQADETLEIVGLALVRKELQRERRISLWLPEIKLSFYLEFLQQRDTRVRKLAIGYLNDLSSKYQIERKLLRLRSVRKKELKLDFTEQDIAHFKEWGMRPEVLSVLTAAAANK